MKLIEKTIYMYLRISEMDKPGENEMTVTI